jgi:hypothetical protein
MPKTINFLICLNVQQLPATRWLIAAALCTTHTWAFGLEALNTPRLPQTLERTAILHSTQWQGLELDFERVFSQTSLEMILEQLAAVLPPQTPVWFEHGVAQASWTTFKNASVQDTVTGDSASTAPASNPLAGNVSHALYLWANESGQTEGLFSSLSFSGATALVATETRGEPRPDLGLRNSGAPATSSAWLPPGSVQLFGLQDRAAGGLASLQAFNVPAGRTELLLQLRAYARQHGWRGQGEELIFLRGSKRLQFEIDASLGQTNVVTYETEQDSL